MGGASPTHQLRPLTSLQVCFGMNSFCGVLSSRRVDILNGIFFYSSVEHLHCRTQSNIPVLYPLEVRKSPPPVATSKYVCRHDQVSPGRQNCPPLRTSMVHTLDIPSSRRTADADQELVQRLEEEPMLLSQGYWLFPSSPAHAGGGTSCLVKISMLFLHFLNTTTTWPPHICFLKQMILTLTNNSIFLLSLKFFLGPSLSPIPAFPCPFTCHLPPLCPAPWELDPLSSTIPAAFLAPRASFTDDQAASPLIPPNTIYRDGLEVPTNQRGRMAPFPSCMESVIKNSTIITIYLHGIRLPCVLGFSRETANRTYVCYPHISVYCMYACMYVSISHLFIYLLYGIGLCYY